MDLQGRTVYISQDHFLAEILDDLAQRLSKRGCEVIRGPESKPGQKVILPREAWASTIGRAEIAMFSSRSTCTREMIEAAPKLIGLVNPTIGLETVDTDAATELDAAMLSLVLHYSPDPARALAEAARALRPGGRILVVDMQPHERTEYQQHMGHVWLGFSEKQIGRYLAGAGFDAVRVHSLPVDPDARGPALFVASATRSRAGLEGAADT